MQKNIDNLKQHDIKLYCCRGDQQSPVTPKKLPQKEKKQMKNLEINLNSINAKTPAAVYIYIYIYK